MNVSTKTFFIKTHPDFEEEQIIADFTSGGNTYNEIHIYYDEDNQDWEIWYLNRVDYSLAVCAYSNHAWEIEFRYVTFLDNQQMSEADYNAFVGMYEEYFKQYKLRINGKLATINNKSKGTVTYFGETYHFNNEILPKFQTPVLSIDGTIAHTNVVDDVTKYKVYIDNQYEGYIDTENAFHKEV